MTTTQRSAGGRDFYTPATSIVSTVPGPIEQFVRRLYRVHRLRGGVTARPE